MLILVRYEKRKLIYTCCHVITFHKLNRCAIQISRNIWHNLSIRSITSRQMDVQMRSWRGRERELYLLSLRGCIAVGRDNESLFIRWSVSNSARIVENTQPLPHNQRIFASRVQGKHRPNFSLHVHPRARSKDQPGTSCMRHVLCVPLAAGTSMCDLGGVHTASLLAKTLGGVD